MSVKFSWIPFYMELADQLLAYKSNRPALIEKIREAHSIANKDLPKIESDNANIPDIDPFTVFALFNRGNQGTEGRKALCKGLKSVFGMTADIPKDFDGIPMFNYNQYCFYRYVNDEKRDDSCFEILWNLFEEAIKYVQEANNEASFSEYFEKALGLSLVGLPKLTIGLFQIRPYNFVNLDSANKVLLESKLGKSINIQLGSDYLKLCENLLTTLGKDESCKSFPEFSSLAYDKKLEGQADASDDWFPTKEEYDPHITKEQWLDFMTKSGMFSENYKQFLSAMLDNGGQATCAQLAAKYGNTAAHYNMTAVHLAEQVAEYTNTPLRKDENGKDRFWTVLFVGKNASGEEKGRYIWKMRDELREAFTSMNTKEIKAVQEEALKTDVSLNTILYGPPGTGKTYNTVIYAVAIIENRPVESVRAESYADVVERYNAYKADGMIEFTTFHQSYGYEEFIEGIKPDMEADSEDQKDIEYEISSGLFKSFCERAGRPVIKTVKQDIGLNSSPAIWKVSLEGTGDNPTRTECLENNHIRVGYDGYGENIYSDTDFTAYGGKNVLNALIYKMKVGDIVLSCYSSTLIDAIGVVTGEYEWHDEYDHYKRVRKVNWLVKGIREDISEANGSSMTLSSVYRMNISLADVMAIVSKYSQNKDEVQENGKNYVFIIDEINRGNISKIFGELITLIEPSKRIGQEEGVTVRLPYSKKPFGVPDNVYLIGTMNTADRSIAAIDTALRRRFQFKEMQPDPAVLDGITVDGVSIKDMLIRMNKKISVLYDREHTIGHAYFIPLKNNPDIDTLASIFQNNIIPLLQEYFYDDYEKIRMVLGDNNKASADEQFIQANSVDVADLFGNTDYEMDESVNYEINPDAFYNIEAYRQI